MALLTRSRSFAPSIRQLIRQLRRFPLGPGECRGIGHARLAPNNLHIRAVGIVEGRDRHGLHIADRSVRSSFQLRAAPDLSERRFRRRKEGEVVEPTAPEHLSGRLRKRWSGEDLERMKDGRGPDLQKGMSHSFLGHVERLSRVEYSLVERRKSLDVLREECDVVDPVNEFCNSAQGASFSWCAPLPRDAPRRRLPSTQSPRPRLGGASSLARARCEACTDCSKSSTPSCELSGPTTELRQG